MTKVESKITTYKYNEEFLIDIVETDTEYEAWLYAKNICIKEMMFGQFKDSCTREEFLEIVEANLDSESYIADYIEDYMEV